MAENMRRNFAGVCSARKISRGEWRLTCGAPNAALLIVRGADSRAELALEAQLTDPGIEWQEERVLLYFKSEESSLTAETATVIVHESAATLYCALKLANFDDDAQRFWQRVFLLVNIPGGRLLLGLLSRLRRGT